MFAVLSVASQPSLMEFPTAVSQEDGGEQIAILSALLISLRLLQNMLLLKAPFLKSPVIAHESQLSFKTQMSLYFLPAAEKMRSP